MEDHQWDARGSTPEHELMIPFVRMLARPVDFHSGSFRNVTVEQFYPRNPGALTMVPVRVHWRDMLYMKIPCRWRLIFRRYIWAAGPGFHCQTPDFVGRDKGARRLCRLLYHRGEAARQRVVHRQHGRQ
ncbi:hypothetical protein D3876_08385 [Sphingomonas cavernae]|uniref:Uncharacterized protein n=1 Tax=Sphingomonas cavernae TaxID=2320861 RepID=A0A418WN89_9SPHN|nr:hypothetical protein D3876_08385 [Sphingomonas cavernae]